MMSRPTQASAEPLVVERIVERPPQIIELPPQQPVIEERAFKQTTTKRRIEADKQDDQSVFGICSLFTTLDSMPICCPF